MLKGIFLIAIIGVLVWLGYLEDQNRLFNTATSTQLEIPNKDELATKLSDDATKTVDSASDLISDESKQLSDEAEAITAETANDVADVASEAVESASDAVEQSESALSDATTAATEAVTEGADSVSQAAQDAAESAEESTTEAAEEELPAQPLSLSGLSRKIGSAIGSTSGLLSGVSDEASATAALPKLAGISESLSEVALQIPNIPDAAKAPLANLINGGIDKIKPLADKALSLPGVGDILNPVIGPMMETLSGLSQ
ncbi:hypothetical protein N9850_00855 [Granulosicoccus sp.]|nr:hypothetical protein [Granulosicoccus sp.]MDB4222293.1 hypothetical protein [Granulosicoccus sp.]